LNFREYFLPGWVSRGRIPHFRVKRPIWLNGIPCQDTKWEGSSNVLNTISLSELSQLDKGILPVCHSFQVEETFISRKRSLFFSMEEPHISGSIIAWKLET
jgi:hypothetical protein